MPVTDLPTGAGAVLRPWRTIPPAITGIRPCSSRSSFLRAGSARRLRDCSALWRSCWRPLALWRTAYMVARRPENRDPRRPGRPRGMIRLVLCGAFNRVGGLILGLLGGRRERDLSQLYGACPGTRPRWLRLRALAICSACGHVPAFRARPFAMDALRSVKSGLELLRHSMHNPEAALKSGESAPILRYGSVRTEPTPYRILIEYARSGSSRL
jgi:hypothetical protein